MFNNSWTAGLIAFESPAIHSSITEEHFLTYFMDTCTVDVAALQLVISPLKWVGVLPPLLLASMVFQPQQRNGPNLGLAKLGLTFSAYSALPTKSVNL